MMSSETQTRHRGQGRQWPIITGALLSLLLAAVLANGGAAHADLTGASPARMIVLTQSPAQVRLTFQQRTVPSLSDGKVTSIQGAVISTGFFVDPSDGVTMRIALRPNLPDGTYTVQWQTVSEEDNETAQGEYSFTVATMATAQQDGSISTPPPRTPSVTFDGPNTRVPPLTASSLASASPVSEAHTHTNAPHIPAVVLWLALAIWIAVMVVAVVAIRQWRVK